MDNVETYTYKPWDSSFTAAGSDKMEVKDQNTQAKVVQIKDQQVQAERTAPQQGMC